MKKLKRGGGALLSLALCLALASAASAADGIALSEDNFPDAGFLAVAQTFDSNGDGALSSAELAEVKELVCPNAGIGSLSGIECFTELVWLDCSGNSLTELDVSKNTALQALYCGDNALTELDVSHNTALVWLDCNDNALTALNVRANTVLEELDCDGNDLTSLDVSANASLYWLDCAYNALTSLDVSGNSLLEGIACDFQTVPSRVKNDGGVYYLDLAALVGAENLSSVSGLKYDSQTGAVVVTAIPAELTYTIPTGYSSETMTVTISVTVVPGDVNGDGKVRTSDGRMLIQYLVGKDVAYTGNLDVNGDGKIRTSDVRALMQYFVGKSVVLY